MRNLVRTLAVFLAICTAVPSAADETSDLNAQFDLIVLKIKVAREQKVLVDLQKALAEAQRDIAKALLDAEKDKLAAAVFAPPIKMVSGTLSVVGGNGPHPSCNALPFLRSQCNGLQECPAFTVNENICGVPGATTDPMLLSVKYMCGGDVRTDEFPYGRPANLTCY
jgi:hypothetical protein